MIVTMDSILRKVLSQANAEQNQSYPPHIYDEHFNIATKFLLGEIAKLFPTNNAVKELAKPFMVTKDINVVKGVIPLPTDPEHRHTLGLSIFVTPDFKTACKREGADIDENDAEDMQLDRRSVRQKVTEVEQFQYDRLSKHSYKKPTLEKPIACLYHADGLSILPHDVPMVQMSYLRQPKEYRYGYTMNPDDTYRYDPAKGVESEWNDTATEYLFKAINILYSSYVRDPEQREWAQVLKQTGLF